MPSSSDLLIRGGVIVAHDGQRHQLIYDGYVRIVDSMIVEVGIGSDETSNNVIDARNSLVIPGFIDTHCHLTDTPYTRGFLEDGIRGKELTGLYEYLPAIRAAMEPDDELAAAEVGVIELLKSGVTTVVELGYNTEVRSNGDLEVTEGITRVLERSGIRAYIAPRYKSGHFCARSDGQVGYEWYSDEGMGRFDACINFASQVRGRAQGRIEPMLAPAQVDTCTPALLQATAKAADKMNIPVQVHTGQSTAEFHTIWKRHGMTQVEYLRYVGLLNPRLIIGHGIFLASHRAVKHSPNSDLELIASAGTSVAHCPVIFARWGILLNFPRYRALGINMCLGTDTFPLDMLHEMRWAAICGKIAEEDPSVATAGDIFEAATVGGAKALGRADLGRIAPGCRADIAVVSLRSHRVVPVRDPVKALVYSCAAADVQTVIVDGRIVVDGGKVIGLDEERAMTKVQRAAEAVWARMPDLHRLSPLSLAIQSATRCCG